MIVYAVFIKVKAEFSLEGRSPSFKSNDSLLKKQS